MDYTSTAKPQEMARITPREIISHFANAQKNNQSGIIDKYFNYWANLLGVNSAQCRRLAELFSQAVDAPKTGQQIRIPPELKSPRTIDTNNNNNIQEKEFIWMKMLNNSKKNSKINYSMKIN